MLEHKIPVYLILGTTSTKTSYEIAAKILSTLNKLLTIQVNTEPLLEQSKKIIKETKKQMKDLEDNKDDKKQIMYS
jgi:predicted ATP-grasp superfamily ATP-dependent carboligase